VELHALREWKTVTECYICFLAAFTGGAGINHIYTSSKPRAFTTAYDEAKKEELRRLGKLPPEDNNAHNHILGRDPAKTAWSLAYRTVIVSKRGGWEGDEGRVKVTVYGEDTERGRWYKVKPSGSKSKAKLVDAQDFEDVILHVVEE